MGATTFHTEVETTGSAEDTWRDLYDEAKAEYGYDPYNGSISTTSGVRVVPVQPRTIEDAYTLADTRINNLSKWEVCEAIPVAKYTVLSTRTVTRLLKVPHGTSVLEFAAANLTLRDGETIASIQPIVTGKTKFDSDLRDVVTTRKVTVEASKVSAETRFFIVRAGSNTLPSWESGHPSQAAARAGLTAALPKTTVDVDRWAGDGVTGYEIFSITRRADGSPLVTGTAEPVSSSATYEVVLEKRSAPSARTGWLIYGWVAS